MRTSHKLRTLFGLVLLLALLGVSPIGSVQAQTDADPIDTADRAAVVASFDAEFDRAEPAANWTGNRATCAAGTTSAAYRSSIFSRINWYRAMAGVPADITEDTTKAAAVQQAALMMSETDTLSHYPDPSFECYTTQGATVAAQSNLALGLSGLSAIDGYFDDPGANNTGVGHRNWILHPPANKMATGDVAGAGGPGANALYVFDNVFGTQPDLRESAGFVAWPPRGYVPGEVVYPRWSFGLRGADMSGALVRVSVAGDPLPAPVVHRSDSCNPCGSAPFPIVVFEPQGVDTNPELDTTYSVIITGVKVNGISHSYSYTVAILGDVASPTSSNCRQAPVNRIYSTDDHARASLYRLYCAYFLRFPDLVGFDYWYGVQTAGTDFKVISDSFELSAEFELRYGSLTNDEFLVLVYENVLERPPEPAGYDYWMPYLESGNLSRGDIMLYFSASTEFKNKTGTT